MLTRLSGKFCKMQGYSPLDRRRESWRHRTVKVIFIYAGWKGKSRQQNGMDIQPRNQLLAMMPHRWSKWSGLFNTEWPKKMYTLFTHQYLWNKLWQCLDANGGHFEHLHWIQNSRTSLTSILLLYKYSSYNYRVIFFMSKFVYIILGHSVCAWKKKMMILGPLPQMGAVKM
jgi:hypothetical protein